MYSVSVRLTGTAPLLMNRFPNDDERPKGRRKAGEVDYQWRLTAYIMPGTEDQLAQPGSHIEAAMAKAASQFKVAGRGRSTYRDLVRASVIVIPDMIPYGLALPVTETNDLSNQVYIDRRPVVIQRARVMKSRVALSAGWQVNFSLQVLDDQIPVSILQEILVTAGQSVGIGDYRPKFGRFSVNEFILVK